MYILEDTGHPRFGPTVAVTLTHTVVVISIYYVKSNYHTTKYSMIIVINLLHHPSCPN